MNRVISNQIKNLIRNNYGTFAKPCVKCPFNESNFSEDNLCGYTSSGEQCDECPLFKKWNESKKNAHDIKLPKAFDFHDTEVCISASDNVDYEAAADRMHKLMEKYLTKRQYTVYKLLFVDNLDDIKAAELLGYKTTEKNRKAGYRNIKNLKKLFKEKAKKILEKEDVFYG